MDLGFSVAVGTGPPESDPAYGNGDGPEEHENRRRSFGREDSVGSNKYVVPLCPSWATIQPWLLMASASVRSAPVARPLVTRSFKSYIMPLL